MAETETVSEGAQATAPATGAADIVFGILSYNDAETVAHVVSTAHHGLTRYFPNARAVIVNADGGSRDGTLEAARSAVPDFDRFLQVSYPVFPVHRMTPDYPGVPGKGNAVRAVFELTEQMGAQACAIIQSDLRGITPEWADALIRPIIDAQADYVAPRHQRHKYEATLLSSIVYPLVRALFAKRVHEPIGSDFAFSSRMARHYLKEQLTENEVAGAGCDVWLATQAMTNGFRMAEARLGTRVQTPREPHPELSGVLVQVLGALFFEIGRTAAVWQRTRGSATVPAFGADPPPAPEPPPVDPAPMVESFRLGYHNLHDVWKAVLPPATLVELKRLATRPPDEFRMADAVWARIVYDFVLAHRVRVMDRDHLLRALTPLYLGWLASYVLQVRDVSPGEAEHRIEALCLAYETQKAYLISRWRWPDKFNP